MERDQKDPVKEFLRSVREAKFRYLRCLWQVEDLRTRCASTTAAWSDVPGGGGEGRKDGALLALADKSARLPGLRREWENREQAVDRFLDGLPEDTHRCLMKLRYVDLLRWTVVQERMEELGWYYSDRQIFNLHGKALSAARALWKEQEKGETT